MRSLRLVEIVLGILTLILWGSSAYLAIPAAADELPSHQVRPTIVVICLPLFIPLLLLLSEGFWARHVKLATILGLIWGVLAALGGLVLLLFVWLLPLGFVGYQGTDAFFIAVWVWWIGGMFLLWGDAAVLFTRVWRKR